MAPASTRLDREGERLRRRTVGSIPGPPALEVNALPLGPSDVPSGLQYKRLRSESAAGAGAPRARAGPGPAGTGAYIVFY